MWWKRNRWKVLVPLLVVAVLAAAFWYGGGAPGLQGWTVDRESPETDRDQLQQSMTAEPEQEDPDPDGGRKDVPAGGTESPAQEEQDGVGEPADPEPHGTSSAVPEQTQEEVPPAGPELSGRPGGEDGGMTAQEKVTAAAALAGASSSGVAAGSEAYSEAQGMVIDPATGKDQYLTDPVPEGKPLPVEPQDAVISDTAYTCTLSISCAAILAHMDWLDPEKTELVPEDGWILEPTEVTFYEGESVFNVLQRTCKQKGIHMEFENTPMYNSAYIEGIHNLYEFDCGELSGWMYQVNEWFPNYGCSRYQLKDGDVVCWEYTCDLGVDIGGYAAAGG